MKKYLLNFYQERFHSHHMYSCVQTLEIDSLNEALDILEKNDTENTKCIVTLNDNSSNEELLRFFLHGSNYDAIKNFFKEKHLQERTEIPAVIQNVSEESNPVWEISDTAAIQKETAVDYAEKIDSQFKELRTTILEYKQCVAKTFHNTGFRDLAILMRDMENSTRNLETGKISTIFVNRLKDIFEKFGIESIEPHKGETLDPQLHEKYDLKSTGNIVTNIITKGWRFGDDILLKAVVETD